MKKIIIGILLIASLSAFSQSTKVYNTAHTDGSFGKADTQTVYSVLPISLGGTNNGSLPVTSGTIYYGDGTKIVGLSPGTSSQILHGGTTPSWKDTTAGGGSGSVAIGSLVSGATQGSILFAGTGGQLQQINSRLFYDSANTRFGIGLGSASSPVSTISIMATGTATLDSSKGLWLGTTEAATSGNQKPSPILTFNANGFATSSSTSQPTNWQIYSLPIQNTGPNAQLIIRYNINGGTYSNMVTFNSSGVTPTATFLNTVNATTFNGNFRGGNAFINAGVINTTSTTAIQLVNSAAATSGVPVQYSPRLNWEHTTWNGSASKFFDWFAESRGVAGSSPVQDTLTFYSKGQDAVSGLVTYNFDLLSNGDVYIPTGKLIMNNVIQLKGYTVSTLPTGVTIGASAYVTDALTTPTYGGTATGGGSTFASVKYNGTAWIYQ